MRLFIVLFLCALYATVMMLWDAISGEATGMHYFKT